MRKTMDPLGLIFPRRCPVCDEIADDPGKLVCGICSTRLSRVRDPWCQRCGKPLASQE